MAAANYNLIIDQGSDFAIQLTIKEDGLPKDITGYNARAQLRAKRLDVTAAAEFTCTVLDPSAGTIKVELANAVSTALAAGLYYYDLEIYMASDAIVTRLLQGQATITQEITR